MKPEAAQLLRKELARPGMSVKTIAMGTNTDYQPIEEHWRITRQIIEVLAACNHPMMITTKSARVVRRRRPAGADGGARGWSPSRSR